MPHPVTNSIKERAAGIANRLRDLKRLRDKYPQDTYLCTIEDLEIAALLLEQTSAARIKKAIHALHSERGKWLRRGKEAARG